MPRPTAPRSNPRCSSRRTSTAARSPSRSAEAFRRPVVALVCAGLVACAGLQEPDPALSQTPLLEHSLGRRATFAGADPTPGKQVLELEKSQKWQALTDFA